MKEARRYHENETSRIMSKGKWKRVVGLRCNLHPDYRGKRASRFKDQCVACNLIREKYIEKQAAKEKNNGCGISFATRGRPSRFDLPEPDGDMGKWFRKTLNS